VDVALASNSAPGAPDAVRASRTSAETKLTHRVKRGETLFSIAKLYRTTVDSLKQWNRIRGNGIQAGQRLTILRPRTVATN
jgi:membrane-bound lytic murein transglycosylase D